MGCKKTDQKKKKKVKCSNTNIAYLSHLGTGGAVSLLPAGVHIQIPHTKIKTIYITTDDRTL